MLVACLAALVCILGKWGVPEGIYFSFVTSLTIGYGDLAPNRPVIRNLSVVIGLFGSGRSWPAGPVRA